MVAVIVSTHALDHLLSRYGYAAVFVFVGMESLGVPFPGETMLITAALYAGVTHHLVVWIILAAAAAGAIAGDNAGFAIGRWGGYPLLRRHGSKIGLRQRTLKVGRLIFDRHGGKVVFFGRFVVILRTYAAFLAGINRMPYARFLSLNAAGGILWAAIYSVAFYYVGSALKRIQGPIEYAIGGVALVIVVAFAVWTRQNKRRLEDQAEKAYPGPLDGPSDEQPGAYDRACNRPSDRSRARAAS